MKTMICRVLCLMLAIMGLSAAPAMAAGAWVPDPCSLLGTDGTWSGAQQGTDGKTYDYYTYTPVMTNDEMIKAVSRYQVAMENLGYETYMPEIQTDFGLLWLVFVKADEAIEIIYDAAEDVNYYNLDAEGDIQWLLVLAVPQSAEFTLGRGVPGVTMHGEDLCKLCNGSGKCTGCSGRGGYYIGKVYYICGACNGNKLCNMCDGAGVYDD